MDEDGTEDINKHLSRPTRGSLADLLLQRAAERMKFSQRKDAGDEISSDTRRITGVLSALGLPATFGTTVNSRCAALGISPEDDSFDIQPSPREVSHRMQAQRDRRRMAKEHRHQRHHLNLILRQEQIRDRASTTQPLWEPRRHLLRGDRVSVSYLSDYVRDEGLIGCVGSLVSWQGPSDNQSRGGWLVSIDGIDEIKHIQPSCLEKIRLISADEEPNMPAELPGGGAFGFITQGTFDQEQDDGPDLSQVTGLGREIDREPTRRIRSPCEPPDFEDRGPNDSGTVTRKNADEVQRELASPADEEQSEVPSSDPPSVPKVEGRYSKNYAAQLKHALEVLDAKILLAKYAAVDTGAELNIVNRAVKLTNRRRVTDHDVVISANNSRTKPSEIGDFYLKTIDPVSGKPIKPLRIRDASKIPNAPISLLSVSLLTDENASFFFSKDEAYMDYENVRYPLEKVGGLYLLRLDEICGSDLIGGLARCNPDWSERVELPDGRVVGQAASLELYHERLGHIDPKRIRFIFNHDLYHDMKIKDLHKDPDKAVSNRMNAKRVHIGAHKEDGHEVTQIGERVWSDVAGPFPPSLLGGFRYVLSVTDEYSRYSLCFFLKAKSDASTAMRDAIRIYRAHGKIIRTLRTDQGGEYGGGNETSAHKLKVSSGSEPPWWRNSTFAQVLAQNEINHELAPSYTPALNSISEAWNKLTKKLSNAFLYHSKITPTLWPEAFAHSNRIANMLPRHGANVTPYELWHHRRPDPSKLRIWGCDCFEPNLKLRTGESKDVPGAPPGRRYLYLGESIDRIGFRVMDPETLRISTKFHLHFDEGSVKRRTDLLRHHDRRMQAFREGSIDELPIVMDDFEQYEVDSDERESANRFRQLFSDYDRGYDDDKSAAAAAEEGHRLGTKEVPDSATNSHGTSGGPVDNSTIISGSPTRESGASPGSARKRASQNLAFPPAGGQIKSDEASHGRSIPAFDKLSGRTTDDDDVIDDIFSAADNDNATERGPFGEDSLIRQQLRDFLDSQHVTSPARNTRTAQNHDGSRRDVYTPEEAEFIKHAEEHDFQCIWDTSHSKGGASGLRYKRYSKAKTLRESIKLMGHKGASQMRKDIRFDFLRGLLRFPGRTSLCLTHWHPAVDLARDCDTNVLPGLSDYEAFGPIESHISDQCQSSSTVAAALEDEANIRASRDPEIGAIAALSLFDDNTGSYTGSSHMSSFAGAKLRSGHAYGGSEIPAKEVFEEEKGSVQNEKSEENRSSSTVDPAQRPTPRNAETAGAASSPVSPPNPTASASTPSTSEAPGVTLHDERDPLNYKDLRNFDEHDREIWIKSMEVEWEALKKFGTFEVVDLSEAGKQRLFSLTWVYRNKRGASGAISKAKSRLVARGFLQLPGLHFAENETYAGVLSYCSLRLLCALSVSRSWNLSSRDISNAYLNSALDRPLYTELPDGKKQEGKCLKLLRGLYGLRQSGWLWQKTFSNHLIEKYSFKRSVADPAIFYKFWTDENGVEQKVYCGLYVDDCTVVSSSDEALKYFDDAVSSRFDYNPTEMRDLDAEKGSEGIGWVLSTEVRYFRTAGILEMNQTAAIERIAARFGLTDSRPLSVPLDPNSPLLPAKPESTLVDVKTYLSLVGSLLHVSQVTRPDIAQSVGVLTRFSSKPTKQHWDSALSVACYLYHTKDKQLRYVRSTDKEQREIPYVLTFHPGEDSFRGFADADYAGSHDSRSTTGYIFYMFGGPLSWCSRVQRTVSQSTTEAECQSLAECIKETLYLKLLLEELNIRAPDIPVPIHEDNSAATIMATSEATHPKAKHYRVRIAFIRENTQSVDGAPPIVKILQTPTDKQLADGFTKTQNKELFKKFQQAVICDPFPLVARGLVKEESNVGGAGVLDRGT